MKRRFNEVIKNLGYGQDNMPNELKQKYKRQPLKNPKPYEISSLMHNLDMNYLRGNIKYKKYNKMYDILNELYDFYEELQIQEKKQK